MSKLTVLILSFFFTCSASATLSCKEIIQNNKLSTALEIKSFQEKTLSQLKKATEALVEARDLKPTATDLKNFTHAKTRSLPLIGRFLNNLTFFGHFWLAIESLVFPGVEFEDSQYIKDIEDVYSVFRIETQEDINFKILFSKAKGSSKKATQARVKLLTYLKKMEVFLEVFWERDVDLTMQEDFLHAFGVGSKEELSNRILHLNKENDDRHSRIKAYLSQNDEVLTIGEVYSVAQVYFFPGTNTPLNLSPSESSFYSRYASKAEVLDLLRALRPSPDVFKEISDMIEFLEASQAGIIEGRHMIYGLLLSQAYHRTHGEVSGLPTDVNGKNRDLQKHYLITRDRIRQAEVSRVLIETQFSNYLDKTEQLNARHKKATERLDEYSESNLAPDSKILEKARELLPKETIIDFDQDLVEYEASLSRAEALLDEHRELELEAKRNQDIQYFEELNGRWKRLLPNKAYTYKGPKDVKAVVFTSDVIDFFKNDPLLGSRYLALLNNPIYVANQKASGLRKLPDIHTDFRDIKLIGGKGKKRIVGKWVNGTIYFFHVYDSEKPYNSTAMNRKISNYNPSIEN